MTLLLDQEEITRGYIESEIQEVTQQVTQDARTETAKEMLLNNEPIEKVMKYSRLSEEIIRNLQKEMVLQPI